MSVFLVKGKGWRYDFTLSGARYTGTWFKTKREAKQAETNRREAITNPIPIIKTIPTDMDFLTLANKRLDYVKQYDTHEHYRHTLYHVKRWVKEWGHMNCGDITGDLVETFILTRSKTSAYTANKDLRYLRSLFNYGIKRKWIKENPASEVDFLPEDKKRKYLPPKDDVLKVISVADPDTQDYLWTLVLTAARMGEVNSLTWEDVNLEDRYITLWTRKRKGGNREPRDVPMVAKLYQLLSYRYTDRDREKPWVFWHTYWSRKRDRFMVGPYCDRKRIMSSLCKKAGVKYFRFHPFRHFTASILDDLGVPIGVIQRILGHQNRRTTEGYLHSIGEAERLAMDKLEKVDIFSAQLNRKNIWPTNVHKEFWQRKVKRPKHDILNKDVRTLGFVGAGKKYGVSDNAVRKWLNFYEKSVNSDVECISV